MIPDYRYFAVGSAFNASDQLRTRGALMTPNWRGCRYAVQPFTRDQVVCLGHDQPAAAYVRAERSG